MYSGIVQDAVVSQKFVVLDGFIRNVSALIRNSSLSHSLTLPPFSPHSLTHTLSRTYTHTCTRTHTDMYVYRCISFSFLLQETNGISPLKLRTSCLVPFCL